MSRTNLIGILVLAIIIVLIAIFFFIKAPAAATPYGAASVDTTTSTQTAPQTVEQYVTANLNDLAREATTSTATTTYTVTGYEAHGGAGTVRYSDGEHAYVADFTYNVSAQGSPAVTSFKIRP